MRTLLDAAGPGFLVCAYLGRLPAAMNQLGLLLVVSAAGRSLALAGAVVAAVGLGTAFGAPFIGRLHDRAGAWRVTTCALVIQMAALIAIWGALSRALADWIILVAGAIMGMANPQAGSVARAVWSSIARAGGPPVRALRIVRVGMGWETAADETSFVIGPVAAGGLVVLLGARGTVVALGALTLLGEGLFVAWLLAHRRIGRSGPDRARSDGDRSALRGASSGAPVGDLLPVLFTVMGIGVVFGTTQTALTAVHAAHGTPGLTGPVYGSMGITSALVGFMSPGLRIGRLRKTAVGGAIVLLCSLALMSVPSTALAEAVILCLGAAVGMTLVTCYSRVEELAPAGRVTGVMAMASTGSATTCISGTCPPRWPAGASWSSPWSRPVGRVCGAVAERGWRAVPAEDGCSSTGCLAPHRCRPIRPTQPGTARAIGAISAMPSRPQAGRLSGERVRAGSRSTTSPRAVSMASMTSSPSLTPEALTFSVSCSGREAPTRAAET